MQKSLEKQGKTMPNQAKIAAESVPAVFWGPSRAQRLPQSPKSTPKRAPRTARAPLRSFRGTPRATKSPQRAPRGSPRALLGGLGRGKIEKKSVTEAKKVDFSKSAPRLGPADARSTLDPLKSSQNRAGIVQSRFLSGLGAPFLSLWSLESGLGALGGRFGSTQNP